MDFEKLFAHAIRAKNNAYAPYSKFPVGAALLGKTGMIYSGCNVESSSYGLSMCAERVALYKAVSEGEKSFTAIAIVTNSRKFCPPCGACRQILWDMAGNITIIFGSADGRYQIYQLSDLFPHPFGKDFLNDD